MATASSCTTVDSLSRAAISSALSLGFALKEAGCYSEVCYGQRCICSVANRLWEKPVLPVPRAFNEIYFSRRPLLHHSGYFTSDCYHERSGNNLTEYLVVKTSILNLGGEV